MPIMFYFKVCGKVPEKGASGRLVLGGGSRLVEVEGMVVWGGGSGERVYMLDKNKVWKTDYVDLGVTLGVCEGRLVAVGSEKEGKKVIMWREVVTHARHVA